jgi:hypothetical protein
MKRLSLFGVLVMAMLIGSCASAPKIEQPQFTHQNYNYTILLTPHEPSESPQLSLALSLLQMEYPEEDADFLNYFLYEGLSREAYRDKILAEQRTNYRENAVDMEQTADGDMKPYNWRYAEVIDLVSYQPEGIILERNLEVYAGGEYLYKNKRYLVMDMIEQRQLKIDDFFANFQEETKIRDFVYEALRRYSKLEWGKSLSEGIYFSNAPELTFNFFLTEEGMGLHWDPHQIAPYSYGDIQIILPWQMIRPLMLYPGVELLPQFNIHLFDTLEES